MHDDHKVLEITDEEALKKENITIENTKNEFDVNIKKLEELKNKIENEMKEIDNTYIKVDKETTKSYELKREKLKKEEEDLKEKLKTEVTKIKEKLENYLSQIYNLSNDCDKIIKGLKSFQKEEKNMIKTLSYVSTINKTQKNINSFFQQPMINLNLFYNEEKGKIEYKEYSFNIFKNSYDIQSKILNGSGKKVEYIYKLQESMKHSNMEEYKKDKKEEELEFENNVKNIIETNVNSIKNDILNSIIIESSSKKDNKSKKSQNISKDVIVHLGIQCNNCGMLPIVGIRYKCVECDNYNLCSKCEENKIHPHLFYKIKKNLNFKI